MPRSDDYAAGYRAGVEAAAARCRTKAADALSLVNPGVMWRTPLLTELFTIEIAIRHETAAREIEKLLEEPAREIS